MTMERSDRMRLLSNAFALGILVLGTIPAARAVDPFHRQYSDIQTDLGDLAKRFPQSVQVFSIGKNDTGQEIQGIKSGDGPMHTLVVGTHHGNEYGATEVALAFAHAVAEVPIKGQTVYVIPVLNVSGYNARTRTELGRDPNRDYVGPCGSDGPWHLRSTKALADFIDRENVIASATLHTYSPFVLYPWGFSTHDTKTEYNDVYIDLAKSAALDSGYPVGNSTDALYPADGCYEDYAMWKYGIWSLLFEMGSTHTPNQVAIDELIRGNVPGLRRFLEQAPTKRADKHAFTGKCDTDKSGPRRIDE
ncbi:MAG: succinylglutamate desuccinylase/aspartoacylase family protein [Bdellovibrionales bacterium]|nr:succinylglutamate desuccinylase/aspartoacylase family protein [Bdellovibrionales bacterium]